MTAEIAPVVDQLPATLAAWLASKARRTCEEYAKALQSFARFVGADSGAAALRALLAGTRGDACRTAESWRGEMLQRGLSAATVNLKLAALRSAVDAARRHQIIEWALDVDGVKSEPRRDSRGPAWADYERMVDAEPSVRNRAILRLLGDRGLRRSEVAALTMEDFGGGSLFVRGKGRREKEPITINERTHAALDAWIDERGTAPGPLFGVEGDHIHAIVAAAGKRAGLKVRPHGLRHAAITQALDITAGNVRSVQQFARHSSPVTTMAYDDARADVAAKVAALVGA